MYDCFISFSSFDGESEGKKILTRGAAKQNATLCIGYRYVSIYVYSLHPLRKHISCTFFTVCSHILSRVHVCSLERSAAAGPRPVRQRPYLTSRRSPTDGSAVSFPSDGWRLFFVYLSLEMHRGSHSYDVSGDHMLTDFRFRVSRRSVFAVVANTLGCPLVGHYKELI